MDYVYTTEMVCAKEIHFHIEDDVITNITTFHLTAAVTATSRRFPSSLTAGLSSR